MYTLASQTTEQILWPKIWKIWKYYLFTDYIQKFDRKFENCKWIRKKLERWKKAIPIHFSKVNLINVWFPMKNKANKIEKENKMYQI